MKVDNIHNSTNFGLKAPTHAYINKTIMRNLGSFDESIINQFENFVQKPDFDEKGLKIFGQETCNNHFYYVRETFRPRLSHLDFDGNHNALSKYLEHIYNFLQSGSIEEAARAKHFGDDITVGLHVKRGTVLQKYKEVPVHTEFEYFLEDNKDIFLKRYSKSNLDGEYKANLDGFGDLFDRTVDVSLGNEVPTELNRSKWFNIAQDTVNLNIDFSKKFFNLICKHLKNS